MPQNNEGQIESFERVERVRQAVIARRGKVTVGDIVSETGFSPDVAESALRSLITTHEGVMKVTEHGEIRYEFTENCIARDYRSWWQRYREAVFRAFKVICKVLIMLILVIYFIIYMIILLALLFSGKNNRSSGGFELIRGGCYIFWGWGGGDSGEKKEPLYNRLFNFIFGPEEEVEDPMELQKDFAQLVRSKNGVITAEDWMITCGKSLNESESDLARYTAIYNGDAKICNDGTLVYVFEDMMKSASKDVKTEVPDPAWERLWYKREITGNESNVAVIGLNLFNLIMACVCYVALMPDPELVAAGYDMGPSFGVMFGLCYFPILFSLLVFAGPLIRLPGIRKENRRRRHETIRSCVLENVDNARMGAIVNASASLKNVNHGLRGGNFDEASIDDVNAVLDELAVEMNADVEGSGYKFKDLIQHSQQAEIVRKELSLNKQDLGRVVFSTDLDDEEAARNQHDIEVENFEREMQQSLNIPRGHDYHPGRPESANQSLVNQSYMVNHSGK